MNRLRVSLQQRYKDREEDIKIHTPRNLETLKLTFRGERVAKVCKYLHVTHLQYMHLITTLFKKGHWNPSR